MCLALAVVPKSSKCVRTVIVACGGGGVNGAFGVGSKDEAHPVTTDFG